MPPSETDLREHYGPRWQSAIRVGPVHVVRHAPDGTPLWTEAEWAAFCARCWAEEQADAGA